LLRFASAAEAGPLPLFIRKVTGIGLRLAYARMPRAGFMANCVLVTGNLEID
jgi:hypothetical protein